ncbi:MAG: aldo/keto reductase [Candidatus Taylorbacteria bacterium]|nr:aldo/keto reductase [Candidatus Taylorbacteria bacterium]
MNIPTKKLKNGFELPELGLGTLQMGGREEANSQNDEKDIVGIRAAIEMGITHIDTAESYGNGHAEELVGEAIQGMNRKKLFITSKVSGWNQEHEKVLQSCKTSLKHLRTDYLDLYLLHEFPPDYPLEHAVQALERLVDDGLVKHIGVSNFGVAHLKEAQSYTKHHIVCNQVHYNLQVREVEQKGFLEYCQKNDILLVAYRPVQKGKLLENVPKIMEEMCVKYQKTPAQIAINWLMAQQNVVTLMKTSDPAHLKENLGAVGWYLTEGDVELLRKEYPDQVAISDVCPLG